MSTPLLWHLSPNAKGRPLVMFPFLGGFGASYIRLVRALDANWDVWSANPPGHASSTVAPHTRLEHLVTSYVDALRSVLRPDAVFFGHSMGAVVAYHVLRALEDDASFAGRWPTELVMSASSAPPDLPVTGYATLPEAALLKHLQSFAAIPDEVLKDRSLIEMFMPAFRADYAVLEDAKAQPVHQLDTPAHLILGELDPQTAPHTPAAWQRHLSRPLRTHLIPGEGHMFVLSASDTVAAILNGVRTNHEVDLVATGARTT